MPLERYGYKHHGPAVYVGSDGHIPKPVETAESQAEIAESSSLVEKFCCHTINPAKRTINNVRDKFADAWQAFEQSWNFTHHTEYFGEKVGGYCHEKTAGWFDFVQEDYIGEYIRKHSIRDEL